MGCQDFRSFGIIGVPRHSRDIPEPLYMSLSDDKERESLLSACPVPLKCLAYVVDCLWQVWLPFSETSRSPGLVASESDPVLDTLEFRALLKRIAQP